MLPKIETWSIERLKPWAKNPRSIKKDRFEELKSRLKRQGQIKPLLVTADGTVIGGNMRLKAMQELGIKEVCVSVRPVKTDKEIFDEALTDNEEFGYYEDQAVAELALELGFGSLELERYELHLGQPTKLNLITERFGPEAEDDEPPAVSSAPPQSVLGEVYQLGRHRLMCGDSAVATDVQLLLNGVVPTLMATDPPYGVEYDPEWRDGADLGVGERSKGKVNNDSQVDWSEAYSLFPGNVAYVWHAGVYSDRVAQNLRDCGFNIVAQIIWAKQHFAMSRGDYHWQHEPCWYAVRQGKTHNWRGDRKQTTIWNIKNNNSFGNNDKEETWGHGTQKPVECMARPVRNNTSEGQAVYDPFGGTGTTLVACERLNRTCYMMELDPKYCDVIRKRYIKLIDPESWEETWQEKTPSIQAADQPK